MSETAKSGFDEWAVLELMGHRKLAGRVSEATLAGGAFVRIDVPGEDGNVATQFYAPGAVYCITPCSEDLARRIALSCQPEPVTRWELPERTEPRGRRFETVGSLDGYPGEDDEPGLDEDELDEDGDE